ncbi:NAD(P)-binding protein [Mycena polygramma]|nr:NAD(P)-binding protein [Mycena polygramma]
MSKGIALVTGAAHGIGRDIALRLADDGFDVGVNDIAENSALLDTLVGEIKQKGRDSTKYIGDVSEEDVVKDMIDEVAELLGGLDVMVANAGVAGPYGAKITELSGEQWDRVMNINARGTFLCYKHAGAYMVEQGRGGHIIGASSIAGKKGMATQAVYSASKYAIRGLTQAAAMEFGPHGINVNAYAPGAIETTMLTGGTSSPEHATALLNRASGLSVCQLSILTSAQSVQGHVTSRNNWLHGGYRGPGVVLGFEPGSVHHCLTITSANGDGSVFCRRPLGPMLTPAAECSVPSNMIVSGTGSIPSSLPTMSSKGVALVTGAAQGIGKGIALRLADDGYDVAVNDILSNSENLDALVAEIKSKGRTSSKHIADVSQDAEVRGMVEQVVERHGGLDVMIANAGVVGSTGPITQVSADEWDRIMNINARGSFLCYKYAGMQMIKQGRGGRIVGASSLAGKKGVPSQASYSASKFAVRGLTQAAAAEFGPHSITVNAYAPGTVDTPMIDIARDMIIEMSSKQSPLGKIGTVEDISSLVSFLISSQAQFITDASYPGQTVGPFRLFDKILLTCSSAQISINGGIYFD